MFFFIAQIRSMKSMKQGLQDVFIWLPGLSKFMLPQCLISKTIQKTKHIFAKSLIQAQLQDAKRRWEDLQKFLHSVSTEREKLQSSNQGD